MIILHPLARADLNGALETTFTMAAVTIVRFMPVEHGGREPLERGQRLIALEPGINLGNTLPQPGAVEQRKGAPHCIGARQRRPQPAPPKRRFSSLGQT